MQTRTAEIDSPIGKLRLVTRGETLCVLEFADLLRDGRGRGTDLALLSESADSRQAQGSKTARPRATHSLERRLRAYFAGDLAALDGIRVDPEGTEFERRVWRALLRVPAGTTVSYGELARRAGVPGAARAVGGACGRNPIALVIPCHRVVGANGSLTGYGGGMDKKRWLLRHEAVDAGGTARREAGGRPTPAPRARGS